MVAARPLIFAVTVGEVVVPLAASPVAPEPAVPLLRTSYSYPAGLPTAGAVHEMVALLLVTAEEVTPVGTLQLKVENVFPAQGL